MDELTELLAALFTPSQQLALAIITLAVISLMQVFKNVYFGLYPTHGKNKRKAILWLVAFALGVGGGVAGYFVGEPPQPLWFWMFVGAASGCTAIVAFKLLVDIVGPLLKDALLPALKGVIKKWVG